MEYTREVISIQSCIQNQSMSKNKEMLENVAKSTNASKKENASKRENASTFENASQRTVSSLINWWNSGGGEPTKVKHKLQYIELSR